MSQSSPSIGLALGGGGAKGLAHILILEAFEEMQLKPAMLAGTSMGAIVGVLYAAGIPPKEIAETVRRMSFVEDEGIAESLKNKEIIRWFQFIDLYSGSGGLFKPEPFLEYLSETIGLRDFEELQIPLKVVAADFWQRSQVVFESGEIIPAVQASMSLPGFFAPVVLDGHVLIDGGAVNPVPYDLLVDDCDIVVAVDVMGKRSPPAELLPSLPDALFNTFQVMQRSILTEKMARRPPDIHIQPEIKDIRALELYKADSVLKQGQSAKVELKEKLSALLERS